MIHISDFFSAFQTPYAHAVLNDVLQILISVSPIVLTFILVMIFGPLWVNYVRSDFFSSLKYAYLEIKLPKEIFKSPLAAESFVNALHNTSDGSKFAQYWKGEKRPSYSLEIVSIEGTVRFFVWTEDRRKAGVMSALYAQFPGIEVQEVEDYTKGVQFDPKTEKMWAGEFKLTKSDAYPIKTYVDYGLDKDPKEEFKVDPLVPFLEFLGNLGFNQQVWIQFIIRAHIAEQRKPGHLFMKTDTYVDEARAEINKIMKRDPKTKIAGTKDEETGRVIPPTLSDDEKMVVEAIGRNLNKQAFDVGIRAVYLAKKEFFDKPNGIGGIVGGFKHFSSEVLNGLKPNGDLWYPKFKNDPWEDYKNMRMNRAMKLALEAYKRRCFFYPPFNDGKILVLSSEELATLYHFPGQVAGTPTLSRIPSKKGQAPSNLPI